MAILDAYAIDNPFNVAKNGTNGYSMHSWDKLWIGNQFLSFPMPGLVISATPTIEVELERQVYNIEPVGDESVLNKLSDTLSFQKTVTREYYSENAVRKPKTVNFTLLIYTADDFNAFQKIAKGLSNNAGAAYHIIHPLTDLWQFKEEFVITSISSGMPDLVNGWEVNISFTEKNAKPVDKKVDSKLVVTEGAANTAASTATEAAADPKKKPKGTQPRAKKTDASQEVPE